jgi:hypothetical protein
MGLLAIEAAPKYGSPIFLADQHTGDMTAADWAARNGVSFQSVGASIAASPPHWLPQSKTVESSRGRSRGVARASVAVAVCVLWLLVGAVWDNGLCGERDTRAQGPVAPVRTTVVEQKQILERGDKKIDIPAGQLSPTKPLDAAQDKPAQAPQSVPPAAGEQKQAPERQQEWDSAEALALALTSSLRAELDAVRSAAEAASIMQKQSLDHEQGRADALARELASFQAELDSVRVAAGQDAEAETRQKQALDQERNRADALAREVTSLRADLDAARIAGPEVRQAAEAEITQKQALEQERGRAEALAREVTSLRADLDAARTAGAEVRQAAEAEI